jgi:hypothetical protein
MSLTQGSTPFSSMILLTLAVPEPAHRFGLRGVVNAPFGELDAARIEKVSNTVEAGLPVHMEPVVRGEIERTKCFASLRPTLLKELVKHLFPTSRVDAGGVRDHTVEIEQDGVVLVAGDRKFAPGLPHRSLSCYPTLQKGHPLLSRLIEPVVVAGKADRTAPILDQKVTPFA